MSKDIDVADLLDAPAAKELVRRMNEKECFYPKALQRFWKVMYRGWNVCTSGPEMSVVLYKSTASGSYTCEAPE